MQMIRKTIESGKKARVPVSMCGEMASDPRYTRLLLGMGLNYFSVPPNAILEVKNIVNNSNASKLHSKARRILNSHDINEIESLVDKLNS